MMMMSEDDPQIVWDLLAVITNAGSRQIMIARAAAVGVGQARSYSGEPCMPFMDTSDGNATAITSNSSNFAVRGLTMTSCDRLC